MDQIKNIIRYWRNSLADEEKIGLDENIFKEKHEFLTSQIKKGSLPINDIKIFFDEAESRLKDKIKKENKYKILDKQEDPEKVDIKELVVIIAPFSAVKAFEHGERKYGHRRPNKVFPLWMVAKLSKDGHLRFHEDKILPWVERRCLTPNESEVDYPIIGSVEAVDQFYVDQADFFDDMDPSWSRFYEYAYNLLVEVIGDKASASETFKKQGYASTKFGYILPTDNQAGSTFAIIATYDQYIAAKDDELPNLLKKFVSLNDPSPCLELEKDKVYLASRYHLGQMSNSKPLTASQRVAIGHFWDKNDNRIFAINGPPGTGKTTFLQSVISSLWIKRAIEKRRPPIIVASSTNNQAIENILDSFEKIKRPEDDGWSIRWLPDFDTYGVFLPASSKVKEAERKNTPHLTKGRGKGNLSKYYDEQYLEKAKPFYINKFNNHFNTDKKSIKDCIAFLHDQLRRNCEYLNQTIHSVRKFYLIKAKIDQNFDGVGNLKIAIKQTAEQIKATSERVDELKNIRKNWIIFKDRKKFWLLKMFRWVTPVKKRLMGTIQRFSVEYESTIGGIYSQEAALNQVLDKTIDQLEDTIQRLSTKEIQLKDLRHDYSTNAKEAGDLLEREHLNPDLSNIYEFENSHNILCFLDNEIRYRMFIMATHYYEGIWLEMSKSIDKLHFNKEGCEDYWKLHSMLMPCIVTTLHSGPAYFQYLTASKDWKTLSDFIDLLIIDEAGQVAPHLSGAMISISKRALFVGDIKQIEPIVNIPEGIDLANAKKHGVCQDGTDYDHLKQFGILCSGNSITMKSYGNTMVIAQRKSKYKHAEMDIAGMFLKEHWRCVPEIIAYCNELCYQNALISMKNDGPYFLPRLGYLPIKGLEQKEGGSRNNPREAQEIIYWLQKNYQKILDRYPGKNLDQCVGIITPFTPQTRLLKGLLGKNDLDIKKVGTVHALQGAEKPIIIFSPVYTLDQKPGTMFFDRTVNMLNVAVSRAEESFLVFGDVDIFNEAKERLPSGMLAKYMFKNKSNRLMD